MQQPKELSDIQYSTLFYNTRHLIVKWAEGREPFVIAECYLPEIADTICTLHENKEKTNES